MKSVAGKWRTTMLMAPRSALLLVAALGTAAFAQPPSPDALQQQVADTERAFAQTMADRDHVAFRAFLAEEAIFFSGDKVLRGKEQVAVAWQRFFDAPAAPFSWTPDRVEVLDSGTLALSSGPVYDPAGKPVGRFNSVWRRDAPGVWHIVFDKGEDACP
jgi:ketosteroid isomerase-like protein